MSSLASIYIPPVTVTITQNACHHSITEVEEQATSQVVMMPSTAMRSYVSKYR